MNRFLAFHPSAREGDFWQVEKPLGGTHPQKCVCENRRRTDWHKVCSPTLECVCFVIWDGCLWDAGSIPSIALSRMATVG